MKTNGEILAMLAAAEERAAAVEAVPFGQPIASARDDFRDNKLFELKQAMRRSIFPFVVPANGIIGLLTFCMETWTYIDFVTQASLLHFETIDADPDFAKFLRSSAFLDRIHYIGRAAAASTARPADEVGYEACARYMRNVAAQLVGRPEHEPAATILSQTIPSLEARVDVCLLKHDEHNRAELARIDAEQKSAAVAIEQAERHRRDLIADFFTARAAQRFIVGNRVMSGIGLAHVARQQGARDQEQGEFVQFGLEELEGALKRAQAADAA